MTTRHLDSIGVRLAEADLPRRVDSFEAFYAEHHRRVLAISHALADGRAAAEDIAQEAFVRVLLRWDRVRVMERPDAWVRRVAVNLGVSRRRRLAAEARALLRVGGMARLDADDRRDDDAFWRAVRRLPPRQAQAVALHYADDLSVADIAAVMGCAPGTVKAHLHSARQTLAERLGLEGG